MSLQQKQNLLVKEIIEKGYNIEAFQKSIDQRHDLEQWDYDELIEFVKKFQDSQNDYAAILKCNKTIPNALAEIQDAKAMVVGYEKIQKGIFKNTSVYFKIETKPINWVVKRTYDDFILLKSTLNKNFTVPNIPNQKKSPVDFTYIKQLRHLQMFLNFILGDSEIRNLTIVQEFLSAEQFTNNQQINFSNMSGEVSVRINSQITNFIKQSDYFLTNISPIQKKAYKLIKQLMKQMQQKNHTLIQLTEVYKELFRESKAQNTRLKDCYKNLNDLFESSQKFESNQIKILNETIYPQQRFQYHQTQPLKELLILREKSLNSYQDFSQQLKLKKEKLYQIGEVVKWDLDESFLDHFKIDQIKSNPQIAFQCMCQTCFQENAQQLQLKNQFGALNQRAYQTVDQIINYTSLQIKEYLEKMVKLMTSSFQQYQTVWVEISNNLIEM
ncbi:unnamed protein product (macronuclear) [Paramecium tetraurelia]|uniref:PX domain-containing protein n=1 Tax=Paramecium tetraurelia TaxID=5888 RepID=A0DWU8_PARTE|nr:uncharacterized protein GSPATT00021158001 [Paramecium tetraurelia]CAK87515.1 unnamed protein product [Paramecium tetraurelia]|eukprot:XP_001454912.1 hypothetical protein (macronuclear) [Paramecium tetraurelia strain d4-2]